MSKIIAIIFAMSTEMRNALTEEHVAYAQSCLDEGQTEDDVKALLEQVATESMALKQDTVQSEIDRLKAENEALKANAAKLATAGQGIKIGQSGVVCLYGLGRFPVSLYRDTWLKLFACQDKLLAFFEANKAELDAIAAQAKDKKQAKADPVTGRSNVVDSILRKQA